MSGTLHWVGVRHHSPAAARHARDLIRDLRPAAVLIEGPADFNDRIGELGLDHALPIALYTWVVLDTGQRLGAYYPFCVYSPEWQALRAGLDVGAAVRFIDLPWSEQANPSQALHRYADGALRTNPYVAALCERLGVDTFDEVWDRVFEVDASTGRDEWIARANLLCSHMRSSGGEAGSRDTVRERYMACRIREVVGSVDGDVVVLTGGFHTSALQELVERGAEDVPVRTATLGEGRGLCLMPYSYESLDALRGYDAGMPNPGFYDRVWRDREAGRAESFRGLLADVVAELRERKQLVSAADLIAVESTARALAALRGHAEVWRLDLLDGITGALVKEEIDAASVHPLLAACHDALRGRTVGRLAEGTPVPELVHEVKRRLQQEGLTLATTPQSHALDLFDDADLRKAQLLHGLRILRLPGIELVGASAGAAGAEPRERWRLTWRPAYEGALIEASAYGPTLREACAARLLESAREADRDAAAGARLLLQACLAGLTELAGTFGLRVLELIRTDPEFAGVAGALSELLRLYRYDPILRTVGRADIGGMLQETWARALLLLATLGRPSDPKPAVEGVAAVLEVWERCTQPLQLPTDALVRCLADLASDDAQDPSLRGAAVGALWAMGEREADDVDGSVASFASADTLGDFLSGLFLTAREQAKRRPELTRQVDAALLGFADTEFLAALPSLRLAFSAFTPREKHHLASTLMEALGEAPEPLAPLEVDAASAARMLAFEAELFGQVRRFGLRGGS